MTDMRRCGHCAGWFESEDYLDHILELKDQLRKRRLDNPFDENDEEYLDELDS